MRNESFQSSEVDVHERAEDGFVSSDDLRSEVLGGVGEEKSAVADERAGEVDFEGWGSSEGSDEGEGAEGSEVDFGMGEG